MTKDPVLVLKVFYALDTNENGKPDNDESYNLTITYAYAAGEEGEAELPETYSKADLAVGYQYNVASEKVEGYVAVPATVSGKIDKTDVNVEVLYYKDSNGNNQPDKDEKYDLTITYAYAAGEEGEAELPETYRETDLAVGYQYNVASEKVEGYVAVPATVSGKIDKNDVNVTVTYFKDSNGNGEPDVDETKYTIHYIPGTEDTVSGMPEDVENVLKNTEQTVSTAVPVRSGYIFTGWTTDEVAVTEGKFMMPAKDVTFTATWTLDEDENGTPDDEEALVTFNVVNGTFEDGSTSRSMKYDLNTVLSENDIPTLVASSGYTGGNWNTTINGFVVRENVVFTYTFDRINIPVDPTDPDDGTDEPTTPTTPTTPPTTPTTPPTTPGTPGTTTDDGDTTDEPEVEEVEDEETPLSDGDVEDVEDNATPKGNNGIWALINLIAAIVTVILGLILLLSKRHRNDEEEDEEERQARIERGEEKEQEQKRGWICKVLGVIVAIVSVVFFILTEDMSLPMALTDKWTIWMIVIAIVELVLVLVGRHWKDVDDEDQEQQA